jgi:RND family efflux transporter MFP subunit
MRDTESAPTVRSVIAEGTRWIGREARQRKALAAAVAGALLLIPLLGWIFSERRAGDVAARRLTLTPSVALVGTLSPTLSDSYGAAVPGVEVKILWLVEEGTLVGRGQKLIQFDPAPFQKELDTARARAQELGGEADQGRLAVAALGLRMTGDLEEKRSSADRSERELSTLVNTTAPLTTQESANDVEMRERLLQEAQTKLDGLEPFVAQGYVSQEEYRTAVTRRDQASADLKLARARYAALVRETNPDLIRRKSEETQAFRQSLTLQAQRGQVEKAQAEAAARVSQARLSEANRQIGEAEKKIAACTVVARAPGLAVHSEVFDKGGERRKIRVGDAVWGGTTVVTLPDLSHMQVEGRVPESEIHLLTPGQRVKVRLDAFPRLELTGALKSIGSVSASEKNESRTFPVTVAVDEADPRFRPGMIARCWVSCGKLENVVALPVEAVRSDDRGPYVLVVSALGPPSRRSVKLGTSTSRYVEVREGLKAGEVVRVTGD